MMMSLDSDRPARTMVQPDELSPGQRKALTTIRDFRMKRVRGGWQGAGSPRVTLPVASYLGFKRLVIRRNYRGQPCLEITQEGRDLLDIVENRRRA